MKRQLSVLCALAVIAVGVMSGVATAAPRAESVTATFTGGPDTITNFRCVPADSPVTCHGAAGGDAVYSGGWIGTSHYDYRFLILPSGTYMVDIVERFAGKVEGCGQGTFVVRTREIIAPTGVAHGRWVIGAGGTGDFVSLAGTGTSSAVYTPDGAGSGAINGRLICRG